MRIFLWNHAYNSSSLIFSARKQEIIYARWKIPSVTNIFENNNKWENVKSFIDYKKGFIFEFPMQKDNEQKNKDKLLYSTIDLDIFSNEKSLNHKTLYNY